MTTVAEARDIMLGHGTTATGLSAAAVVYGDTAPTLTGVEAAWARVTVKHAGGAQRGIGGFIKRYIRFGVLCVELFCRPGSGKQSADNMGQAVLTYLESASSSQVAYRNIRVVDVGQDGGFTKTNVYADFEYDHTH